MTAIVQILRASPLTSIQDEGRFGMLRHGVSASGPMDRAAFAAAGRLAGAGIGGIEFTRAGLEMTVASGRTRLGFAGGHFVLRHNGTVQDWHGAIELEVGDTVAVTPGSWGNYGYLRFGADVIVDSVMGSLATSSRVGLGGLGGRSLRAGDVIELAGNGSAPGAAAPAAPDDSPIRIIWGLHADLFSASLRSRFVAAIFDITTQMDRMGVRLGDTERVFADATSLSLVSDAIVPGDIQIQGDGTPVVLMRDHQPTGGYPRIATVISADLDRFAQLRPGAAIAFAPVSVEHAQAVLRSPDR